MSPFLNYQIFIVASVGVKRIRRLVRGLRGHMIGMEDAKLSYLAELSLLLVLLNGSELFVGCDFVLFSEMKIKMHVKGIICQPPKMTTWFAYEIVLTSSRVAYLVNFGISQTKL